MPLSKILSFLDLLDNLLHLLGHLTPLQLSLRGHLLWKESNVLLKPRARIVGSSPDLIHKAILDHVIITYKLESCAKGFNFCQAGLVVTFNLDALIGIKVNISVHIGFPIFVVKLDLVRPLSHHH